LMAEVTPQDHADAAQLAREAGDLLLEIRARIGTEYGASEAKVFGDQQSHELLTSRITALHPGDSILSEEGEDVGMRLETDRVWIIDPLDGTREFGEPPRDDWAVHVALIVDGNLAAGAVALPGRGLVLSSHEPADHPVPPESNASPRILVSRTRPPAFAEGVATALGGTLAPMGSAGAKAMAVVLGEADVYIHAGGQYEWDSAAPVAVASRAGLHVSRVDGSALRYNQADPWLPDLLVCRPELARPILDEIARQAD
jgi:3'(2'), 5'-bisphosphate nucleotidase